MTERMKEWINETGEGEGESNKNNNNKSKIRKKMLFICLLILKNIVKNKRNGKK